jgi:uncharacterized protein
VIRRGHYLIDLHCGDLVEDLMPFSLMQESGNAEVDGRARALAVAFGLPYVVVQPSGGGPVAGTTNGAAAQAGIPAVIAEAGGVGQLDPNAVDLHLRGLPQALRHLGMLEADFSTDVLISRGQTAPGGRTCVGEKVRRDSGCGCGVTCLSSA